MTGMGNLFLGRAGDDRCLQIHESITQFSKVASDKNTAIVGTFEITFCFSVHRNVNASVLSTRLPMIAMFTIGYQL